MAITRARKKPTTAPKAKNIEVTPEKFIAGAETPSDALPESPPTASMTGREERALAVVESYLPWSAAAGILPLPGIDMALIIGVQLRDRKSTRLNSSHIQKSRMPSSA